MATRIDPQGQPELVARRTRHSKSFQQPDGSIRVVNSIYPVHWDNAGTWEEVDDTLITNDGGVTWQTTNTPYLMRWESDTLTLTYRSKKGGDTCRIRLLRLDGVPVVTPAPLPTVTGRSISAFVAPDLEIELRVRSHGVEIFKTLHGPLAPTSLTWGVQTGDVSNFRFDLMNTSGRDNILRTAPTRTAGLNRVRRIEITHSRTADDFVTVPGRNTYEVTETFTGRTRFIDPITSARSWVNEFEYPVEIDVTVNESVVGTDDDGTGSSPDYWQPAFFVGGYGTSFIGIRFQTVDVPQGATITSAIITVKVVSSSGAAAATMKGQNVDSAPAWASGSANNPASMTATTASTSVPIMAIGTRTIDVTTSCQEIVNRAAWTNNNHMRFGYKTTHAAGSYMGFEDYSAVGVAQPTMQIIYTAAAGDFSLSGSIAARPGGSMGPRMRRALLQRYPDSPITPVELTQSPAAPFRPGRGPAGGPMMLRRNLPGQPFADTPVIPTELTQSPAAPFRPGRGPGMGPMLLRRNLAWPLPGIPAASTDVTVALTGVEGTGAVGTLGVQHDQALTGNEATGSVGTLTPGTSVALTGLSATGSVGTLAPSTTVALTGVAGTGSVGTFTPGTTLGITGLEGTGSIGTLAPSTTVTLTGNEATVTIGTLFPSGDVTVALTGVSATLSIGDLTASGADGPVVPDVTNTPGFRRLGRSQLNVEDEAEKLARRIREGTIKPPAVETPKDDSAYFRESARLAQAIATARADAETSRKAIARYTKQQELKRDSAKVEAKLIRAEQALLLARITEEALMEEMEVIDIAYLAVAVLSITLQ